MVKGNSDFLVTKHLLNVPQITFKVSSDSSRKILSDVALWKVNNKAAVCVLLVGLGRCCRLI